MSGHGVPRATTQTVTVNVDNSPSRPTGVDATVTDDDVLVSWDAVTANPAVAGYRVFRDGTQIATVSDTSYTDADRPNGTYEYTVVAVNSRGAGQPSEPAGATVAGDTTPPSVTFDYGCNGTKVHDYLDFRPLVADDRGPVIAEVLLDGGPFPGGVGVPGPRMTIDFDTRRYNVPNGMHTMTIVARDGAGNETSADCEWNVQNPAVTVPFTAPADGDTVRGTVNLAAQVLTDGAGPDWTGQLPIGDPVVGVSFEVVGKARQFDSTKPYALAWDSTTVPNGTHTVRARVQWMDYSLPRATSEIQITVDNPPPLPAPTGVAASVTGDDVTVTWDAVAGATGYRVHRDGVDVGTSAGTSYTNADVPAGTHQYRVIAVDGTRNSVPSAAVSATVAPSGLVAAYGFEQTSGTTVTDSSGRGSTGTLSGATWATGGKFGRALSFDGVNDLVTVADSDPLDLAPGMTLEAWVKPTTVSGWRTIMLKERPGQLTYGLFASGEGGRPMAEVAAGTQRDARGTAALPVGTWTHVAATYDKATLRLYVNGTQVSSTAVSGTLLNSAGALRIGGNTVWGEYFSGLIDEVRVYERALSAAEIAADKDRPV